MDGELLGAGEGVMEGGVGPLHPLLLRRLGGAVGTGEVVRMRHRHFHVVGAGAEILLEGTEILTGQIGGFPLHDAIPRRTEVAGTEVDEAEGRHRGRVRARLLAGKDMTSIFLRDCALGVI